jgi:hypothetical protein
VRSQPLKETSTDLLLGTGEVTVTGIRRRGDGVDAVWALSWAEQRAAGISPIIIRAYYGTGAHHPHLRGGSVGDWPLNVFDEEQAAAELPALRAVAAAGDMSGGDTQEMLARGATRWLAVRSPR